MSEVKRWIVTAYHGQQLNSYIAYCDRDPVDIILDEDTDLWQDLVYDLYNSYGELYLEYPDTWDELEDNEQDEWYEEEYHNWCNEVSFGSYEDNEGTDDNYEIIIDERN